MGRIVARFSDGSFLEYDRGKDDEWCVYLTRRNVRRFIPEDWQYFKRLHEYSLIHGADKVYDDFVHIYNRTTKEVSEEVLELIKNISKSYGLNELNASIIFSIIYLGMIAEENKERTRLGKRIKRLGIHQTIVERMNYNDAAKFSIGKKWWQIDEICKSKGF
jgi:hypothetical protein